MSAAENIFVKPTEQYVRDIDLLPAYHRDMATGMASILGITFEEALEFVKNETSDLGTYPIVDPKMWYVGRNSAGDRLTRETTFFKYIKTITDYNLIVSPSLAVYKNKEQKESITAIYIARNVKRRSKAKKEMFAAMEAGDKALQEFKNLEQNNAKIKNNALSGGHCSKSTILFIDTIHSSLTSTCRSASGYGNSNNEKITCGNRHYWSPDIVVANILNIINTVDSELFQQAIDEYSLHIPTVEETMACVVYSSRNYWRDRRIEQVHELVKSLTDLQRAAFVYTSDLYQLKQYNDELMRDWLGSMAKMATTPVENPKDYVVGLTEETEALVSLLCGSLMDGKGLGKFDEFDSEVQGIIGATALNLRTIMSKYELLTKVILVSECMPPTLAHLPEIIRRGAIASDTDSTIFTVQDWLKWYSGEIKNDPETINIGHVVTYLTSSTITHILAKMSANMGVARDQIHQYAMKSEYWYPVFVLTSRAKTYYALQGAQEGIVFKKPKLEKKGAVLKGSNSPAEIVKDSEEMIMHILNSANEDKDISAVEMLTHIAELERGLFKNIRAGDSRFFKKLEVKEANSYKNHPYQSNYFHYLLWDKVFAPKYGTIPPPPYQALRISLNTDTTRKFNDWIEGIKDEALKTRLVDFLKEAGKKGGISNILLPKQFVETSGLPEEIIHGLDDRNMVGSIMEQHYVIMESLRFFFTDANRLRLISDEY